MSNKNRKVSGEALKNASGGFTVRDHAMSNKNRKVSDEALKNASGGFIGRDQRGIYSKRPAVRQERCRRLPFSEVRTIEGFY